MRQKIIAFAIFLLTALVFTGAAFAWKNGNVISFETYKEWRDDKDTVVLDAAQLEPLQWIVPENVTKKRQRGITQAEFDRAISEVIPKKETRVVLYCYETFMPTRRMSAMASVANVLKANGYTNIHTIEKLWDNPKHKNSEDLRVKEFEPYTKSLPDDVLTLLNKARGNSLNTPQKEETKNAQ